MQPVQWVEVDVRPPGSDVAERVIASARRMHDHHLAVIGNHRGFDPRRRSFVERRVHGAAVDVMAAILDLRDPHVSVGGNLLTLARPDRLPSYDLVNHERRLRATMHVSWSWPDLPMWLAVGRVSATRSALRLSLRSRLRLRYPARYFDAAHSLLTALTEQLPSS